MVKTTKILMKEKVWWTLIRPSTTVLPCSASKISQKHALMCASMRQKNGEFRAESSIWDVQ